MRRAIFLLGPLSALAACCAAPSGEDSGWIPLFHGKDLDGWVVAGGARWRVEDGVIVTGQDGDPKRGGTLSTAASFRDFELELDFMIDEHGKYNSGVYLRNDPASRGRSGYQVNIGRGAAGEYSGGVFLKDWLAKGDERDEVRRVLDWNTLRIRAVGPRIQVDLNGRRVSDALDPAPTPKLLQSGVVSLQTYGAEGHSGWVKFRNLRIRDLEGAP
jgi:hypothetical protein